LRAKLEAVLEGVSINGSMEHRLPHNLNMSFAYVEAEALMTAMSGVAVSSGSACTSAAAAASMEPSYVLKAMGLADEAAYGSIRFSLGRFNTEEEVDYAAASIIDAVANLRELSPTYDMAKGGKWFK
jgi:cysteine desulfurase